MKNKCFRLICVLLIALLFNSIFFPLFCYAEDESVPEIYSPCALLMDYNSGKILYEKNINDKMYPASLTKIMTAIIVIENCNLDDVAIVSYDAVMDIPFGYVTANLQIGEELTVEQLLNVLMVGSSNDAAIVLAEHVSGSVEDFAKLMNDKAKELGCQNTNFVNPNGEHDENHYSTAYDLAIISRYAMQYDTFRNIVSKTVYKLPATNKYDKDDRYFTTTNYLLVTNNNSRTDNYYYKYATGIKTGFTTPAGNCLVASSKKDNFELISVVLGGGQTKDGLSQRYLDTIALFDYGYDNYVFKGLAKKDNIIQTIKIKNATKNTKQLEAIISDDIYALIKKENKDSSILPEVKLKDNLKAPIKKGDVIGSVKYTAEGIDYEADLIANNDVKKSYWFVKFIIFLFILLLCFLYLLMQKKKRVKRKAKRGGNI